MYILASDFFEKDSKTVLVVIVVIILSSNM